MHVCVCVCVSVCVCLCVYVWPYSGPEVTLFWWGRSCAYIVHPITCPFAFLSSLLRADLGRARFFPSSRTWYPGRNDFIR